VPADDPLSETGIGRKRLVKEFGENWRSWKWFRDQWTKTSLATVGGLLVAIGAVLAWAWNLNTHVTILENRSDNEQEIAGVEKRVTRIEGVLDLDYAEQMKTWAQAVRYARAHRLTPPPPPNPKGVGKP